MAMTLRLPPDLTTQGQDHARSLGISFNALLAVALRDYLDSRQRTAPFVAPSPVAQGLSGQQPSPAALPAGFKPPASRSDPCPCGAKDAHGHNRLKYKHCHGRLTLPSMPGKGR